MKQLRIIEFKARIRYYLFARPTSEIFNADKLVSEAQEDIKNDALCNRYIRLLNIIHDLKDKPLDKTALQSLSELYKEGDSDRYIHGFYYYIAASIQHNDTELCFKNALECLPHCTWIQRQYTKIMQLKGVTVDLSPYIAKNLQMVENAKTLIDRTYNKFITISNIVALSNDALFEDIALKIDDEEKLKKDRETIKRTHKSILNDLNTAMILDSTNLYLVSLHCKLFLLTVIKEEFDSSYPDAMRMFDRNCSDETLKSQDLHHILSRNLYRNFLQSKPYQLMRDIPQIRDVIRAESQRPRADSYSHAQIKIALNLDYLNLLFDLINQRLWERAIQNSILNSGSARDNLKIAICDLNEKKRNEAISALKNALSAHSDTKTHISIYLNLLSEFNVISPKAYEMFDSIAGDLSPPNPISYIKKFQTLISDPTFDVRYLRHAFTKNVKNELKISTLESHAYYKILQYFSLLKLSDQELLLEAPYLKSQLFEHAKEINILISNRILELSVDDAAIKKNEDAIVYRSKQLAVLIPFYPRLTLPWAETITKLSQAAKDKIISYLTEDLFISFNHQANTPTVQQTIVSLKRAFVMFPNIRSASILTTLPNYKSEYDEYNTFIRKSSNCICLIPAYNQMVEDGLIGGFVKGYFKRIRERTEGTAKLSLCKPEIPNEIWEIIWRYMSDNTRENITRI